MGRLLKVLSQRSYEDIRPVFPEDVCEGVGPVDKSVGRPELNAFFVATHYVYIVSQLT